MWKYICAPFAWLTRLFYSLTGSYGLAIILFTLVVKLVLLPFQIKSKRSMLQQGRLQGRVEEIKKRHPNNRQRQQEEMAELYAKAGVNPMSGCLWNLLPFPILIALYNIIRQPLSYLMMLAGDKVSEIQTLAQSLGWEMTNNAFGEISLAKFIHENWSSFQGKFSGLIDLDYHFLGLDLSEVANTKFGVFPGGGWPVWGLLLLPLIAALSQLVLSMVSMKGNPAASAGGGKGMMYVLPLMTVIWGMMFPAALCIYWIANAVLQVGQELVLNKRINAELDREETDKEREKREKRYAKYQKQRELMAQQRERYGQSPPPQGSKKKPSQRRDSGQKGPSTNENGRVGQRPYARGRSYSEDHYSE